ncbi:hypothetical protein A5740_27005 [Mycobacterium sp. GA-1841]|uniref:GAP family protein n=1 Tax=Mycobacterium sp. GA-1841 TaxID=1834154 RepID=UPI00096C2D73|nr:GAP family protein [Mycobacterium sp. GA-1841]OMC39120.1 hypothetical protein A5740_27005 [Mycobacterium sp. GA-1841]
MWSTVLVMAVVAACDPLRIGVVAFMLSRKHPPRLLLPFFLVAFIANVAVGAAVVSGFRNATDNGGQTMSPALELGVAGVALTIAVLSATGMLERLVDKVRSRRAAPVPVGSPPTPSTIPGLAKLPAGLQSALRGEAPWAAALLGLINGFPTPYYLAAMAAALTAGVTVAEQMAALVMFNVVAFLAALVPIISFWIAPEATRSAVERIYAWMRIHHRLVVAVIAGAVAVFFFAMGLSHL